MQHYGRQSPPLSSPWPAPPRRPASIALDSTDDAANFNPPTRHSIGHQYSAALPANNGGFTQQHDGFSRPNSRHMPVYGGYTGIPSTGQEPGLYGGDGGAEDPGGRGGGGGSAGNDGSNTGRGGGSAGTGVGGDDSTFRERVNQVVQNFYLKAAMTIIHQRILVPPLYASRTGSRKVNVWSAWADTDPQFNLDLDDTDAYREELSLWRNTDVYRQPPPPLVIETYVDAKELTANQTLVLLDEQGKRWNVDAAISSKIDTVSEPRKSGRVDQVKPDVVLERWVVDLRPRNDTVAPPQLPVAYKHGVVIIRTLYTYAGLMPTHKLIKRLAKVKIHQNTLKVSCRVKVGETLTSRWDGLNLPIIEGESQVTEKYSFGSVDTPAGELHINVLYRRHTDFRVDDSEELLSSHFINLDERYFQPSLNTHHRTTSQPQSLGRRDASPLAAAATNNSLRGETLQFGSHTPIYSQGSGVNTSPSFTPRGQPLGGTSMSSSPADQAHRSIQGSKSSLRGDHGISRRPSVSFMQPFKSPSLSNSPSSDTIPPSPRTSVTRISSTTAPIAARNRPTVSPVIPKSTPSYDTPGSLGTSSSPRPPSIGRYSSSFGPRKPKQATGPIKMDDETSSGKGSYSSSIQVAGAMPNEHNSLSDDHKVADFLKLLDSKQPMNMFNHGDCSQKTNTALVKFQQMKDSHNALSDSMSQSVLLQRSSSPSTPNRQQSITQSAIPASSYSPSSSPGKPVSPYPSHTPAVPSRLSAGQTAVYSSGQQQPRESSDFGPASRSSLPTIHNDEKSSPTSPLDIPAPPPRPFHGPRSQNSFSHSQPHGYGNGSGDFAEPLYGPRSASVEMSLSKLAELKIATEEGLPGRASTRQRSNSHRGLREEEQGQTRGGYPGGLSGSGSSSFRGRGHRGTGRGVTYTPPGGSQTYLNQSDSAGSERPSLIGRRTPSNPRGGFGEEEDLLFTMSDMSNARRSMDQDRSGQRR